MNDATRKELLAECGRLSRCPYGENATTNDVLELIRRVIEASAPEAPFDPVIRLGDTVRSKASGVTRVVRQVDIDEPRLRATALGADDYGLWFHTEQLEKVKP